MQTMPQRRTVVLRLWIDVNLSGCCAFCNRDLGGTQRMNMARLEGFEPPTPGSEDRCSCPLSYRRMCVWGCSSLSPQTVSG